MPGSDQALFDSDPMLFDSEPELFDSEPELNSAALLLVDSRIPAAKLRLIYQRCLVLSVTAVEHTH